MTTRRIQVHGASDDELSEAGCMVVRPKSATAAIVMDLVLGTGMFQDARKEEESDAGWLGMSLVDRSVLRRLDRLCQILPDLTAGAARTIALDPSLLVLDAIENRLVVLPGRSDRDPRGG